MRVTFLNEALSNRDHAITKAMGKNFRNHVLLMLDIMSDQYRRCLVYGDDASKWLNNNNANQVKHVSIE